MSHHQKKILINELERFAKEIENSPPYRALKKKAGEFVGEFLLEAVEYYGWHTPAAEHLIEAKRLVEGYVNAPGDDQSE